MGRASRGKVIGYLILHRTPIGWQRIARIEPHANPFGVIEESGRHGDWWIRTLYEEGKEDGR